MTTLGLKESTQEQLAGVVAATSTRLEFFKRMALGGGTSIGIAVVYGAFELLRDQPHDAFPLLKSWGPWAIVSIIAIYASYDLAKMLLGAAERAAARIAAAVEKIASAQQQQADKDDRQYDRMITLTTYGNTRADRLDEKVGLFIQGQLTRDAAADKKMELVLALLEKREAEKGE